VIAQRVCTFDITLVSAAAGIYRPVLNGTRSALDVFCTYGVAPHGYIEPTSLDRPCRGSVR